MKRRVRQKALYNGKIAYLIVSLLLVLLIIIQSVPITVVYAANQSKTVTILFTHDMHDNLLPFQTLENGKAVKMGGYARLKSAIDAEKKSSSNAILVDGGDFSMGTPFQTIYMSDAPELRMLGALGYDVATLGNHEFDYRPAGLTNSLEVAA